VVLSPISHFFIVCSELTRRPHFKGLVGQALHGPPDHTGFCSILRRIFFANSLSSRSVLGYFTVESWTQYIRRTDRTTTSIKTTFSILNPLSFATSLADTFGLACQNALMAAFTSLSGFCRHSHLRKQYRLVSLSYLLYVPFSTSTCGYPCDVQVNEAPMA
jgi:hypothetical protein